MNDYVSSIFTTRIGATRDTVGTSVEGKKCQGYLMLYQERR